jgi:CopG family nickel-responsive transcriptional regulator
MAELERISMTIESSLLDRFDELCRRNELGNRSEVIRDLIRAKLIEDDWESESGDAVATVTLVYDHNQRALANRLTGTGHEHGHAVLATLHVHLDHDTCLEVTALRGEPAELRRFAQRVLAMKGVQHGKLVMSGIP